MKKTKYAWYLLLTTIFTGYLLLGVTFAVVDNGGILDSFVNALTFKSGSSANIIVAGALLYEAIALEFAILILMFSILGDEKTRGEEYWLLLLGLVPFAGPVFGFAMLMTEMTAEKQEVPTLATVNKKTETVTKVTKSELSNHSKVAQDLLIKNQEIAELKAQLKANSEQTKVIKGNRALLLKEANKKKIYVTINKTTDDNGKETITWNTINKAKGTKELYNTKKEALLAAKKVKSPKKVLIQDEHAKFEYWLTYLDDDNTPIVKAGKKDAAESDSNEIMKVMQIKAPTTKDKNIYAQSKQAEEEKETLKVKLREEIEKVRIIKTTQAQLLKEASQNVIYVTVKKEEGKIVAWNTINKATETKTKFKTKKEALLKAKAAKSPKKVLIQDENAKYQYWLTYLDNTNKPLVKVNKKSIAENQSGNAEVMRILEIKDNNKVITKREVIGKEVKITNTTRKVTAKEAKEIREKAAKAKAKKTTTKKVAKKK